MLGKFKVDTAPTAFLPGVPSDYLSTQIIDPELLALSEDRDVMLRILADKVPLPTTVSREGYFGDRHLEFWLSGERDAMKVRAACSKSLTKADGSLARILDFGGASGRVARHFSGLIPNAEVYLCDTNPEHIKLVRHAMPDQVRAFNNPGAPSLPFPDGYLDVVCAFSVFTHIYDLDMNWLMELKRVTRPGGTLYLTIHDEHTWHVLKDIFLADLCFANTDFKDYYDANPVLEDRVVHFYNESGLYDCNVFFPVKYVQDLWSPLFKDTAHFPLAHDHQSAVALTV